MQRVSAAIALVLIAVPLAAQEGGEHVAPDATPPRRGAEFLIPLGSFLLPGLGQYIHGAPRAGLAYTSVTLGGLAISTLGDAWGDTWEGDLPRQGRDQLAEQGAHVAITSAYLSAWDAFHRAVPALQNQGKYQFIGPRERFGDLLSAPFDPRFLRRWTTWVDLAQTAVITALILSDREAGARYHHFRARDAAFATSLAMNAAVGEEAVFRGWLLPLLHQQTGHRFWVANGVQAGLFGAGHLPDAGWLAAYIGAWAAWEGWVVRRNEWSIRESIFHHFWYDALIMSAALLTDRREHELRITFPTITF